MRIFISYGHDEHISFARNLADALQEKGYEVWFDEQRLTGGAPWEEYIEKGLKWVAGDPTGKMILIMTPHSVRRPDGFCLNELAYALDLRLAVLPIMLVWTTPPLSIYRSIGIGISNWAYGPVWDARSSLKPISIPQRPSSNTIYCRRIISTVR